MLRGLFRYSYILYNLSVCGVGKKSDNIKKYFKFLDLKLYFFFFVRYESTIF